MSSHSLHRSHRGFAFLTGRRTHERQTPYVATLRRDERVLYTARGNRGADVVATEAALHYQPQGGAWRRVAWSEVVHVACTAPARAVLLTVRQDGGEPRVHTIRADARLAALAAERITHAHVLRQRVEVAPGVFGVVEALRVHRREGLEWRVLLDDPARREDPAIAAACSAAIEHIRVTAG